MAIVDSWVKEMHITPANMAEADERLRNQEVEIERLRALLAKCANDLESEGFYEQADALRKKIINEQQAPKKATLEELEALLTSEDDDEIEILPDGSCRKIDPKGAKSNTDR